MPRSPSTGRPKSSAARRSFRTSHRSRAPARAFPPLVAAQICAAASGCSEGSSETHQLRPDKPRAAHPGDKQNLPACRNRICVRPLRWTLKAALLPSLHCASGALRRISSRQASDRLPDRSSGRRLRPGFSSHH